STAKTATTPATSHSATTSAPCQREPPAAPRVWRRASSLGWLSLQAAAYPAALDLRAAALFLTGVVLPAALRGLLAARAGLVAFVVTAAALAGAVFGFMVRSATVAPATALRSDPIAFSAIARRA